MKKKINFLVSINNNKNTSQEYQQVSIDMCNTNKRELQRVQRYCIFQKLSNSSKEEH